MATVNPVKNIQHERMFVDYLKLNYKREALFWMISRYSGYRVSDLLEFTVSDIKDILKIDRFEIKERKTGKLRKVVLKPYLKKELKESIKDKADHEKLFRSRQGDNQSVSSRQMGRTLKQAAKEVGLKLNIGTHSGRKTFGYHLSEKSGLSLVQAIFGHSTQLMTMIYIGVYEEMQDEAVMDIPDL